MGSILRSGWKAFLVVLLAAAPAAAQTTETYNFTIDAQGFAQESNQAFSQISRDATAGRIALTGDRRDVADELFTRTLTQALDPSFSFTISCRWSTTQQGNWQGSTPFFLSGSGVTNDVAGASNCVQLYYDSRDSNLGQQPYYYLRYRDESGTQQLNELLILNANTEYHFVIDYDATTQDLTLELRDVLDLPIDSVTYTLGSSPNDGFLLEKMGISSNGTGNSGEPVIQAWVDDILLTWTDPAPPPPPPPGNQPPTDPACVKPNRDVYVSNPEGGLVEFQWTQSTDPDGATADIVYDIEVSFEPTFLTTEEAATDLDPDRVNLTLVPNDATRYWRVRARDGLGASSNWSPAQSFRVLPGSDGENHGSGDCTQSAGGSPASATVLAGILILALAARRLAGCPRG